MARKKVRLLWISWRSNFVRLEAPDAIMHLTAMKGIKSDADRRNFC